MQTALIASAALMGLAGTPHCLAMCGPACTALARGRGATWAFHLARAAGYALAGAVAASSVAALAAVGQWSPALRPLWTLVHVAALGLGLWLLWQGRQPAWMEGLGRSRSSPGQGDILGEAQWRPLVGPGRGPAVRAGVLGLAWVAWPCGLLQSALMVAALGNTPATGALAMVAFAAASSVGLIAGPMLWWRLAGGMGINVSAERVTGWSVRAAGAMLAGAAAWSLGHGLWARFAAWCFS